MPHPPDHFQIMLDLRPGGPQANQVEGVLLSAWSAARRHGQVQDAPNAERVNRFVQAHVERFAGIFDGDRDLALGVLIGLAATAIYGDGDVDE